MPATTTGVGGGFFARRAGKSATPLVPYEVMSADTAQRAPSRGIRVREHADDSPRRCLCPQWGRLRRVCESVHAVQPGGQGEVLPEDARDQYLDWGQG
jgi:hypothetical protein